MSDHVPNGTPCWYELRTPDLDAAGDFYTEVMGWSTADALMPDVTYHLASAADGGMVAGLTSLADLNQTDQEPPPSWLIYFTATDCDSAAAAISADGGAVRVPPTDIPGTGRFAVCTDPQGAEFGLLQPLPMDTAPEHPAFDQQAPGHGCWHELMTTDPEAGSAFYAKQFGWTKGEAIPMGEMGEYQLFQHEGTEIGGMMGLGLAPGPVWLPYFGTDGVERAIERITAAGGAMQHGPAEVPGGAFIAVAKDPHGAWFAVLGPR